MRLASYLFVKESGELIPVVDVITNWIHAIAAINPEIGP